jgi:hypothetical protein
MSTDSPASASTEIVVGDFNRILEPETKWAQGGFQLPNGELWEYREPNAVVLVRNGWLQISAVPYTRGHNQVQILDNAKHMYFSKQRFEVPTGGRITFEIKVAARTVATQPGYLYDGYVSWNLLDFQTGWALDFFTSGDTVATVYGRLPFPGVTIPDTGNAKAFCIFNELAGLQTTQGQEHAYASPMTRARTPSSLKQTAAWWTATSMCPTRSVASSPRWGSCLRSTSSTGSR